MSQEPATGPIPVTPQGPPPPEEAVDQTVRLKAGEPTPPEAHQTIIMNSPASTHPFPQVAPPPSAPTPDLPTLFPDPTRTVTMDHLPEVPVVAPYEEPLPPKRSGLLMGLLAGAVVIIIIAVVVGILGYRAGWFGERSAPPSYADDERNKAAGELPKPVVNPAIQPYLQRAEAGDATAMQMLGHFYYYGMLVPQNREEGLRWYRKAAAAGSVSAQKELANLEGKPGQK